LSSFYIRIGKRLLDIFLSIIGIVILSPILISIALSIRLTMGKPVLFRQARPGLKKESFGILKFRTMTDSKDRDGTFLKDNLRLTSFGRFLRLGSLDELPELWNVLVGDMSLVGPRPLLLRYLPFFRPDELARFDSRPGITGLAQIRGRNELSWDNRCLYDVEYTKHCTLITDIEILARTAWHVFLRQGIHADPESKMANFDEERTICK
jgi:undecaprenyl phosphate N,N'-diacetylbacillosamine 1-phosphate transferase